MDKHGVYLPPPGSDGYEFWWAGTKVKREVFNKYLSNLTLERMRDIANGVETIKLGQAIAGGEAAKSQRETVKEIPKAALCETCRVIVENRKDLWGRELWSEKYDPSKDETKTIANDDLGG